MVLALVGMTFYQYRKSLPIPVTEKKFIDKKTVTEIVSIYGQDAKTRLISYFDQVKINYPPKKIVFLAMKEEKKLEVWASVNDNFKHIKTYDIKRASGVLGPKLREGDRQVPEGIYRVIGLNPNSAYHLSMKLNYPNTFDLFHAKKENRREPGSNIFIHGKAVSIGCLAMGDQAIEELFLLVESVGIKNVEVIISPYDPRSRSLKVSDKSSPKWVKELYENIEKEYLKYRGA